MSAISANLPVTVNPSNSGDLVRAQPICNPDGSALIPGSTAANPNANPATVITGQKKIAVTSTAVALATSTPLVNGVVVTALDTNTAKVTVGPTGVNGTTDGTGNGYVLAPGQPISFGVTDLAAVFINGTAGDGVAFAGN